VSGVMMTAAWQALLAVLAMALLAWIVSLLLGQVSFVDSLWSLFFVLAATVYLAAAPDIGPRQVLVLALLLAWAARLAVHIAVRNHGAGEDPRYQALREAHPPFAIKSLYIVFGLQAVLAWIVSLCLLGALASGRELGWLDALAVLLWTVGTVFEAGGDWQLLRFRRTPGNAGKVLDTGLWRYTRHPNYFGECCIWWAFFLFSVAAGHAWTIFAPVLMTFLLLRVSGVSLLEKTIGERRPAYAEYVRRTNAFLPGPRRTPAGEGA
jgi:steroid 5-alpha reductase family enzyme